MSSKDAKRLDRALRIVRSLELCPTCEQLASAVQRRLAELRQRAAARRDARRRAPKGRTGRPKRALTDEQANLVRKLLAKGKSVRAIATQLEIPRSTLSRIVKRDRLDMPRVGGAWQRRKRRGATRRLGIDLNAIERRAKYRAELEEKLRASIVWRERLEANLKRLDAEEGANEASRARREELRATGLDLDLIEIDPGPDDP